MKNKLIGCVVLLIILPALTMQLSSKFTQGNGLTLVAKKQFFPMLEFPLSVA